MLTWQWVLIINYSNNIYSQKIRVDIPLYERRIVISMSVARNTLPEHNLSVFGSALLTCTSNTLPTEFVKVNCV